jgi:hypothetical protein
MPQPKESATPEACLCTSRLEFGQLGTLRLSLESTIRTARLTLFSLLKLKVAIMSRLFWRSCLRLSKTLRTLALACLLLFAPRLVEGREAAELAVLPFATVLVETGASDIDAGVEFQLADFRARTLLRSPLVREDGRSTGRLGHLTDSATFVGSLLYVHDGTGPDGPLSLHRLGLDFEFGVASYYFYPERSESKESLRRSAFSGGLQYLYYYGLSDPLGCARH